MNRNDLPLLTLFERLRRCQWQIGVDDYLTALHALEGGFGNNLQDLQQLCCILWAKSEQDIETLHKVVADMLERSQPQEQVLEHAEEISTVQDSDDGTDDPDPEDGELPELNEELIRPEDLKPPPDWQRRSSESLKVVQAIRQSLREQLDQPSKRFDLKTEYFPITRQRMQRDWLHMRLPMRQGISDEIDVTATVQKIALQGILLEPVLQRCHLYQAELLLLIDWDGSMVPFHHLSQQFLETAKSKRFFRKIETYYFNNCPDQYLYGNPAGLKAKSIKSVLRSLGSRTIALIISDAGAARGRSNNQRVQLTHQFITQLQSVVGHCIWINPMPRSRWTNTSAEEIQGFLPMLEINHYTLSKIAALIRNADVN